MSLNINPASLITAVGSLFPTTTNTSANSSGTASSNTTSGQTNTATSTTTATGTTNQYGQTISDESSGSSSESFTQNSADPSVIAALKSLAAVATNNASNATGNTSSLVAGLFQAAKDSFASVFSQGAGSGLYNSSTTGVLQDAATARASADAASAVLGYQTQEQGIAQGALQSLLSATATQQVNNSTSAFNNTVQTSDQSTNTTDTQTTNQSATSSAVAATKQKQQQQATSTSTTSKGSIICTWMYYNGYLEKKKLVYSYKDFRDNYTQVGREAYHILATGLLRIVRKDIYSDVPKPINFWARQIIKIFLLRTEQVCWELKYPGARFQVKNWLAKKLVYCCVFPVGLYLHGKQLFLSDRRQQDTLELTQDFLGEEH